MVALQSTNKDIMLSIGLTENEIDFYLFLLNNPDNTAANIARKLKMDKSSAYRAAENLEFEGLIISSPRVRGTTFRASSPEIIREMYQNRVRELSSKEGIIDSMVKELTTKSSIRNTNIKIEYGYQAHINRMEESLKNNKEMRILEKWNMKNPIFTQKKYTKYVHDFAKRRISLGIKDEYLVNSDYENEFSKLMHTSKSLIKEIRIVPRDANDTNSFRIYGDTTEVVSFDNENNFIVVTIKDKFVTDMIRKMFYFIWNRSKIVK